MEKYDWLVIGGGFQGIIAASTLAKQSGRIGIVERANGLGGILRGWEKNDLILDFGCHVFNNNEGDITQFILDIVGEEYHPIFIKYAHMIEGAKHEEISVPSFAHWPKERKVAGFYDALSNAIQRAAGPTDFHTLQDWMNNCYGADAGGVMGKIFEKSCHFKASDVDPSAIQRTPMSVIELLDDDKTVSALKKAFPELDGVMALRSQRDEMRFYRDAQSVLEYRTFYPSKRGMRGFGDSAEAYFAANGLDFLFNQTLKALSNAPQGGLIVEFASGEKVHTNRLVWTLDLALLSQLTLGENPLQDHTLKVPMTLFYYFVDQEEGKPNYDYVHDFRPDTTAYRMSAPGFYGKQVNEEGQSYYCVEVPDYLGSDVWTNPESYYASVWKQMNEVGIVDLEQPQEAFHINTPQSYPMMKAGFKPIYDDTCARIDAAFPDIVNVNMHAYAKNHMVQVIRDRMKEHAAA